MKKIMRTHWNIQTSVGEFVIDTHLHSKENNVLFLKVNPANQYLPRIKDAISCL